MRREAVMLFVGPRGASDERVAPLFAGVRCDDTLPALSVDAVIATVDITGGSLGVLPLEDNMRGEFHGVYDALIEKTRNAQIVRVATLEERVSLQVLDDDKRPEVVHSHPDILSQYAAFLQEANIETVAAANTSVACEQVRARGNPFHAALAPDVVAARHRLRRSSWFTAEDLTIRTRYGLLGHPEPCDADTQYASVVYVEPGEDRAGTLLSVLEVFAAYGINLRRLRSQNRGDGRPHGFVVELDGHVENERVAGALAELAGRGVARKTLGVFPAGAGSVSPERPVEPNGLTA